MKLLILERRIVVDVEFSLTGRNKKKLYGFFLRRTISENTVAVYYNEHQV